MEHLGVTEPAHPLFVPPRGGAANSKAIRKALEQLAEIANQPDLAAKALASIENSRASPSFKKRAALILSKKNQG